MKKQIVPITIIDKIRAIENNAKALSNSENYSMLFSNVRSLSEKSHSLERELKTLKNNERKNKELFTKSMSFNPE